MGLFGGGEKREQKRKQKVARAGFEPKELVSDTGAFRVIDEEAGVLLYGVKIEKGDVTAKDGGYGLTAIPIDQTDLEVEEEQ